MSPGPSRNVRACGRIKQSGNLNWLEYTEDKIADGCGFESRPDYLIISLNMKDPASEMVSDFCCKITQTKFAKRLTRVQINLIFI